jgi:hypothetical protein
LSIARLGLELPAAALYVLVALAGAATIGTQIVLFGYASTHFAPAIRASALGFTSGVGRLGAVTGPLLGGFLVASNIGLAWELRRLRHGRDGRRPVLVRGTGRATPDAGRDHPGGRTRRGLTRPCLGRQRRPGQVAQKGAPHAGVRTR